MPDLDLAALSLDELKELQKDVARAIEEHGRRGRSAARAAAETVAKEHGFTLAELMGQAGSTLRGRKAASEAVYRHPENPTLTWGGRGRRPVWVKDALAGGQSLEELRA